MTKKDKLIIYQKKEFLDYAKEVPFKIRVLVFSFCLLILLIATTIIFQILGNTEAVSEFIGIIKLVVGALLGEYVITRGNRNFA